MWKNKPAVAAAALICAGIGVAYLTELPWHYWAIASVFCTVGSMAVLVHFRRNGGRCESSNPSVLLCLIFSSATAYAASEQLQDGTDIRLSLNNASPVEITCEIVNDPQIEKGKCSTLVRVSTLVADRDTIPVDGIALLTIRARRGKDSAANLSYGSVLRFNGTLEMPPAEHNPGEFSYKDYLALNGIYATIHVSGFESVDCVGQHTPSWIFSQAVFPAKHFVQRVVNEGMQGDAASFLTGLLLGDRTSISPEIKNAFVNTGVVHVLAVSGSHVVLVVAIMYAIAGLIRLPNSWKIIFTIAGIYFYMLLTGSAPSIVRACLMAMSMLLAKLFQERINVYNALGISAVIILLYDTHQFFDVGCQLSFGAVFSMAYFLPKLNELIKKIPERWEEIKGVEYILQLFAVSLAAQIGTIPFTAHYFGKVSLVSLLANLVVVPLAGFNVTIGFASVLVSILSSWAGSAINEVNALIIWFVLKFVMLANAVPYASIESAVFGIRETLFYSAGIAFLFSMGNETQSRKVFIAAAAIAEFFFLEYAFTPADNSSSILRVTFIDVGQGDAALIECPAGEKILVDAGPRTPTIDAGEKTIVPLLRKRGISRLDALVLTHPDGDHLGGVPSVLRRLDVQTVIDAGQLSGSALYKEYLGLCRGRKTHAARAGEELLSIANVRFYVFHPTDDFIDSDSSDGIEAPNNSSVVFKLVYGRTSLLFVGDVELPAEKSMVGKYGNLLRADVLKAGHHGSRTSSSEQFVSIVKPSTVIVSVGKFNKFKHPSKKVLERFRACGSVIRRTDNEGAIILESDGIQIRNVRWRN
ncbi:MAG: DNA internalization-related competence protein ComEC/Rec2 [Ignavibacteriales bacterium]|nr:DNA internalization-related competence protein ComEC/Rec2 [Ignavibacteriales bacterium]